MPAGVWSSLGRWRAFADAVALALGINVWISIVLLPGLFVGAFRSTAVIYAAILPLPILVVGLWRRSEGVLLGLFPAALLLPIALEPAMGSAHVYGPVRFAVVAVGLVAYLTGASVFTSFHEPPPPESVRVLSSARQPVPERWRRRFRVYRLLTLLALIYPVVLIYVVNFDETNQAFMRQMFPGRVAAMTTLLNVVVVGAWVALFFYIFLGILSPHRTGDRDLVAELGRIRAAAKRGRPRPLFYLAVIMALVFMSLLMLTRYY
jgi:hypothetical protein